MKRVVFGIAAIIVLAVAVALSAQQETKQSSRDHWGTWQLVSYKYGTNQPGFNEPAQNQRRIKLITETHFTWVEFDSTTKEIKASAGGAYTLNGNTYTESMDFGLNMGTYIGQKHAFSIRVEGEKFFLSGSLADGLKIEEVWQRVK